MKNNNVSSISELSFGEIENIAGGIGVNTVKYGVATVLTAGAIEILREHGVSIKKYLAYASIYGGLAGVTSYFVSAKSVSDSAVASVDKGCHVILLGAALHLAKDFGFGNIGNLGLNG